MVVPCSFWQDYNNTDASFMSPYKPAFAHCSLAGKSNEGISMK